MQRLANIEDLQKISSFDAHNPPSKDLLSDCVHCGFCLPACPTYVLWGEEMDSPRGRIYMMAKASQGEASLDQNFQQHMDNCLGCMACMTACPSGVQYNKLIEDTRPQVERQVRRSFMDMAFRKLLFVTFPFAKRLRLIALPMLVYQRTGLQKIMRASGMLKLLPERLSMMEELLPAVPNSLFRKLPALTTPSHKNLRVGMLAGCVQQVFFQHVNEATLRVLSAEGYEVVIPQQQSCCGALMVHSGIDEEARALAKKLIATFESVNVDYIVINAAGCGSTMKEYGHLFREDSEWADRANAFSAKCRDISEILLMHRSQTAKNPLALRVAYQDACHLRHAQGIHAQPRYLLRGIPQLDLVEIGEANLCCGSAGVYNLLHPQPAAELGDRKLENLLAAKAQAVASANPGCLLQLGASLRRREMEQMPMFHMIELLDASIRGIDAEKLLRRRM
jgi:glycolate oxidase iron-sulfur subunit